jgi:hypothetical protein
MKKILILPFILFLTTTYGQVNQTTNIRVGKSPAEILADQKKAEGMTYLGNGEYSLVRVGGSGFISTKKLAKKAIEKIEDIANRANAQYEIINVLEYKSTMGVLPKVDVRYRLLNQDGSSIVSKEESSKNKEEAKKDLLDLKELLELGIITQEEYDKKAKQLKTILLAD